MKKLVLLLISVLLTAPVFVYASPATGTIDITNKYAWSDNLGWINFGCDHCVVQVTDTAVTGYAWSENYGWINLSPSACTNCGVKNTTAGVLSGSAWGENTGWVDFGNTTINSSGQFTGKTVSNDIVGQINFSCTSTGCPVTTDWRPTSSTGCGDGICNGSEVCDVCVADCGTCGGGGGCTTNSSCGTDGLVAGSEFCQNGNVYQNYTIYTCAGGACSNTVTPQLKAICSVNEVCNSGNCITCAVNADCGTNGLSGNLFCQSTNVYQNYITYICNNAGLANSNCTNSSIAQLVTTCPVNEPCDNGSCVNQTVACSINADCGTDAYTGSPFCQNGHEINIYQNYITYTCSNSGLISSSCSNVVAPKIKTTCTGDKICDGGVCINPNIVCTLNSDCGTNAYTGSPFCQDGNVYRNYITYTCNNSGMLSSSCSDTTAPRIEVTCGAWQACSSGSCVNENRKHNECNGSQCLQVDGIGIDQCNVNEDCKTPKHNICSQQQCIPADGAGENQCQTSGDCVGGTGGGNTFHNECNAEKQCVVVSGTGTDECSSIGKACEEILPVKIINDIIKVVIDNSPELVKVAIQGTKQIVTSPTGSIGTKIVSTTGAVVTFVAVASPLLTFSLIEIFLIPFRLIALLLTALGLKKRVLPWGSVYDSVTKQPLDPAYVVLKNLKGDIISSAVTDIDGRYGFLAGPGTYKMEARKTNYNFPSQKLLGRVEDELHANLYFGEDIEVKTTGEVIVKNIPLDPVKFDWNEFAKKDKNLLKFYSKWDMVLGKIYGYFFAAGFITAIVAVFFAPYPYNAIIVMLYLFLLILRFFGLKPKSYGHIMDSVKGTPLSFAIVRVMLPGSNVEITSKSADKYGKYYCLVPPGKYYVKIDRKNKDGSYSLAYTSPVMDVSRKGIIKQVFKV